MAKSLYLKTKALVMRRENMSLGDIAKALHLSETTVYNWIRNVPLAPKQIQAIKLKARKIGTAATKNRYAGLREKAYQEGWSCAAEFLSVQCNRDFIVMYLCEGSRRSRWQVAVSNSNPEIIEFATKWIRCNSLKTPGFVLQLYDDLDRDIVISEWCKRLTINPENILVLMKSNAGRLAHRKNRCMLGVMQVRISDTYLKCKVDAWMDYLQKNVWKIPLDKPVEIC